MAGFENDVLVAKNMNFDEAAAKPHSGVINAAGKFPIGTGNSFPTPEILGGKITSPNGTLSIGYSSPNITLDTTGVNDLHTARFIVASSTLGTGANFTTITAAIAAAQGTGINSTIFFQPGTYTENFSLPANINLCAYECDAFTPNVTIVGTITCTTAGTRSISGIRLQTNSAALLAVTGSAASVINLNDCYLNCTNNTGITFSSSSGSAAINIYDCRGDLGTTGIALFSHSSSGVLSIFKTQITNSGGSSTASTCSAGTLVISKSGITSPITTSGTGAITFEYTNFDTSAQNATALTCGGSGTNVARWCQFNAGSASAVSIGATLTMVDNNIISSNTNAVTGAGTIIYSPQDFQGTSKLINTTTQTPMNYGTWTPTIDGAVSGTTTYVTQQGYYTIVGNLCLIECLLNISAATGTGNAILGGFPFTIKNLTQYIPTAALYLSGAWAWAGATGTQLLVTGTANAKTATIGSFKSGAGVSNLQMTNAAAVFVFSLWYEI